MSRYKRRRKKLLATSEKITIVHKVLVQNELRKDMAKEMRICPSVVSRIVRQFK